MCAFTSRHDGQERRRPVADLVKRTSDYSLKSMAKRSSTTCAR